MPPMQVTDDRANIERRAVASDGQVAPTVLKYKLTGHAWCAGHSRAAGIERPDAVNEPIVGGMRMAADDDIGLAPSEQRPKLLVSGVGLDPSSVVRQRRGVDAENSSSVGQLKTQVPRQGNQAVEQSGLVHHAARPADARCHRAVALHQVGAGRRPDR